jgi:hypothetical protein
VSAFPLGAQTASAVVFPRAFVVEHQRFETTSDGSTFTTDPVTDYYGGSWLVSVRPNGNRVILDFARHEITEVDVAKGSYWTLTFRQMGDLRQRLQRAEERPANEAAQQARSATAAAGKNEIQIREISEKGNTEGRNPLGSSSSGGPGVRHLRVSSKGSADVDVWVDPSLPLGPAALTVLEAFENDALGATAHRESRTAGEMVAAARRAAQALPIRTHSLSLSLEERSRGGSSYEDIALRAEPLPALPAKLLKIGDGFRRVSSPLEVMVAFAEEEAAHRSRGGPK